MPSGLEPPFEKRRGRRIIFEASLASSRPGAPDPANRWGRFRAGAGPHSCEAQRLAPSSALLDRLVDGSLQDVLLLGEVPRQWDVVNHRAVQVRSMTARCAYRLRVSPPQRRG